MRIGLKSMAQQWRKQACALLTGALKGKANAQVCAHWLFPKGAPMRNACGDGWSRASLNDCSQIGEYHEH